MAEPYRFEMPDGQILEIDSEKYTQEQAYAEVDAIGGELEKLAVMPERVRKFAESVDHTPRGPLKRSPAATTSLFGGNPILQAFSDQAAQAEEARRSAVSQESPDELLMHNNAASNGVDIETGAPSAMRAKVAIMEKVDPGLAAKTFEGLLTADYSRRGIEVPDEVPLIFRDESTGKMGYYRAEDNGKFIPTLFNPYGPDIGDVADGVDTAAGIVAEGSAAVLGALAGGAASGGSAVGAVAGGAAGAALASVGINNARREVAKALGVPAEVADAIDSDYIFGEAVSTAAFELAGPALVGAVKGFRNTYRPIANEQDAGELERQLRRTMDTVRELNRATGANVRLTFGQLTGDPAQILQEANLKQTLHGKKAAEMAIMDFEVRGHMRDALKVIHTNEVPVGPTMYTVDQVGEASKKLLYNPLRKQEALLKQEQQSLEQLVGAAVPRNSGLMDDIQRRVQGAYQGVIDAEDSAWTAFRANIEYNPQTNRSGVVLDNSAEGSPIRTAVASLTDNAQQALSQSLSRSQGNLAVDLGGAEGAEHLMGQQLDVHQVHRLLSHMKAAGRTLARSTEPDGWKQGDLGEAIDAIERQLRGGVYLKDGQPLDAERGELIYNTFRHASATTSTRANFFRKNAAKEELFAMTRTGPDGKPILDARGNPAYRLNDSARVWETLFKPGDTRSLENVMDVVQAGPQVRAQLLFELNNEYVKAALPNGQFNVTGHSRFLDSYGDHLNLLTGDRSTDFIRNVSDMAGVIRVQEGKVEAVRHELKKFYGPKLDDNVIYGGNIAQDMLDGKMTVAQISGIRNRIEKSDPELWGSIRKHGLEQVQAGLLKASGQEGNLAALNKLLRTSEPRLKEMYGGEYTHNLHLLRDVLEQVERTKGMDRSRVMTNPPWLQVGRSVFGALSDIQRRITAGAALNKALKEKAAWEIASHPERLRSFVKLKNFSAREMGFAQAAVAAGLNIEDMPEEAQRTFQYIDERTIDAAYGRNPVMTVRKINQIRGKQ